MKATIITVCFCCAISLVASAQTRPPLKVLRFEESYDFLNDTLVRKNTLDSLKNIRIGTAGQLSIGGEINQTFEYVATPSAFQKEDGYWLSRIMLHASFKLNKQVRIYGELASGTISGRVGGPRTIDKDVLHTLNLFAEVNKEGLMIRIGRQELSYGGENLISVRNGTNVRYTFDGGRVVLKRKNWVIDGFLASYVNTKPDVFDNPVFNFKENLVWGAYATKYLKAQVEVSAYYMGYKDPQAFYAQYQGKEHRHSLGTRFHKTSPNYDYTLAAVYQLGKADTLQVRAFQLAALGSYRLGKLPVKIGINAYLSSGDSNPIDQKLTSFNPYFPQQASFRGAMATRVFPMNVLFAGPRLDLNLHPFYLSVDGGFLWRHRKAERINIPGGFPAYQPDENTSRHMGNQLGFTAVQVINHYFSLVVVYSHFIAKPYLLKQPNPGLVNDFFIAKIIFKF
jgi:hypothetical protein